MVEQNSRITVNQLLSTKFFIPKTRPELLSRTRLLEQLNDGLHRKLTLISAPAGFGQTAPYTMALVQLEEGPVVTAQLTDLGDQEVEIDTLVQMVTHKIRSDMDERGMIVYGYRVITTI